MNKNFKIIQISGLSGLLVIAFVAFCLFCGLIGFPIWFLTNVWNYTIAGMFGGPVMNLLQGTLLWGIICISAYICARDNFSIKIAADEEIIQDPEMLKMLAESKEKEIKEIKEKEETKN